MASPRRACLCAIALLLCLGAKLAAQCSAAPSPQIHRAYQQHNWNAVVNTAEASPHRNPADDLDYGLALAHLQRWPQAYSALLAGHRACPRMERLDVELAGVAFQQKRFPKAAAWARRALRHKPHDAYALDLAGTIYYLMGNLPAALQTWNRIGKPHIDELSIDPHLRIHRLLLERAFAFAPQSTLTLAQLETTQKRLQALGVFPTYDIGLSAQPAGSFNANFHAYELNHFGNSRTQALLSMLGGLPYETLYPSYYNLHRSATNITSLLRWDPQKRRVWIDYSTPWHALPKWRWNLTTDERSENWVVRRSFTGNAPQLGALHLNRAVAGIALTSIHSGRTQWTAGAELSDRKFTQVARGSALTPSLIGSGFQLKPQAAVKYRLIDAPAYRFTVDTAATAEFARLWSSPPRLYGKLQGDIVLHWLPGAEGDKYEFAQRVRSGGILGHPPFDELYLIGMERDTHLWYRGLIGTRDGRKGSSPLAERYLLSNTDFFRRLYTNGLISIHAGPLFDLARTASANSSLAPAQWLSSAGAEAKLTVLGTSVLLTYGHDLRSGTNAFYATIVK